VQVNDHIFHLGIIDRALGPAAPGLFGLSIALKKADEVDVVEIDEVQAARILNAASENEMKLAHGAPASRIRRLCEPAPGRSFAAADSTERRLRRSFRSVARALDD